MTEQEALLTAKENVEAAMSALDFPQGSHAADEAFDLLDQALQMLEAGLARCDGVEDTLVSPLGG